ncbi:hypothetical protein BGX26_004987 [Mortierella sp. AD094]|nr:hypothetical protein BGX26_004987 [Mortierella sp. AD094]
MSQQQRLARRFLSLALPRSQRMYILQQETKCFHQRSNYSTSSSSSGSPLVNDKIPAILKSTKPDTRRSAERINDRSNNTRSRGGSKANSNLDSSTSSSASSASHFNSSRNAYNFPTDLDWSKSADDRIVHLFNIGTPWREIDAKLGRPLSSCYHRYYTVLDPNLKIWNLPNGQPDISMLKRLVYLVEVEKHSFGNIDKRRLMDKPWDTPTKYAPQEVLKAAGIKPPKEAKSKLERRAERQRHYATVNNPVYGPLRPFNKTSLQKVYEDYKTRLAKNSVLMNKKLLYRAIQRSVELYGENWKKVAVHADMLLGHWTSSRAARLEEAVSLAAETAGAGEGAKTTSEETQKFTIEEREPLYPNKVASIYRIIQRNGVSWGLEDDVVMTRKILNLSQKEPNLLKILAKPFGDSVRNRRQEEDDEGRGQDQNNSLQQYYWSEISIALGNHSPTQCKRRWDGLWSTGDDEKSAQSKSWHRFERFNFWMLWKHFYQQRSLGDQGSASNDTYDLTNYLEIERVCKDLSFVKEISGWMRHRNEAQCEKYFKSTVNSAVRHGYAVAAQHRNRLQLQQEQPETQADQETGDQQEFPSGGAIIIAKNMEPFTSEFLLESIRSQVAEPLLDKMSNAYPEIGHTILGDRHQPLVRPDWTRERIKMLYDIVMQEKQGVLRADFEINWDKVAYRLEKKLETPTTINSAESGDTTDIDDYLSTPFDVVGSEFQYQPLYITSEHCQGCWKYITSSTAAAEAGPILTFSSKQQRSRFESDAGPATNEDSSSQDDGEDHDLQDWSDHELQLLQQGIRKYGNSWADIRAQFLPSKNITELYQTWLSITAPAKEETAGSSSRGEASRANRSRSVNQAKRIQMDRMAEPDYMGLLSAIDKVGGKTRAGGD